MAVAVMVPNAALVAVVAGSREYRVVQHLERFHADLQRLREVMLPRDR